MLLVGAFCCSRLWLSLGSKCSLMPTSAHGQGDRSFYRSPARLAPLPASYSSAYSAPCLWLLCAVSSSVLRCSACLTCTFHRHSRSACCHLSLCTRTTNSPSLSQRGLYY